MTTTDLSALIVLVVAVFILGYVHVGYALIVRLLPSRKRESATQPPIEFPTVSVIIPAHNEEEVISEKLENAFQLDYPSEKLEVIVATDNCSDATVSIVEGFLDKGVILLEGVGRRGKPGTVNNAVEKSTGELLLFSDANVLFRKDALKQLTESLLQDADAGCVSGNVILESEQTSFGEGEAGYYRFERVLHENESRIGSMMGVDGGMFLIWRKWFRPPPSDIILDDFAISMSVIQQQRRILYQGNAIATENATPTAKAEYQRRVRVSAGAVQSILAGFFPTIRMPTELWQYVSHKFLRWLSPLWLVVIFAASVGLSQNHRWALALVLVQLAFYAVAILASFLPVTRKIPIISVVFYFSLSHMALAHGILRGLLTKQSGVWTRTPRSQAVE